MADNKKARHILDFPDAEIQKLKMEILDRVTLVNHRACGEVEEEIDDFIRGWKELSREEKPLVYYTYGHLDKY